ncbi:MAG TPA: hypothetical protein PKW80_16140 [Bacteroidales bacterium]|nr:hypothetical protein [Bacteroidales bacterium]
MKRTLLVLAVVTAIAFLSTSCVKTWVCSCTSLSDPSKNYNYTYELTGKTEAKADCENQQTQGRADYNLLDYTCELE